MNHQYNKAFIVVLMILAGCGKSELPQAELSNADLRDLKTAKRWRIEYENGYVLRKECITALDCTSMRESMRLPLAMYEYRLQQANKVAGVYRGQNGLLRLEKEKKDLEVLLENIDNKPETRDGLRIALNGLQDQKNYLTASEDKLRLIFDEKNNPMIKDSDGAFELVNDPFVETSADNSKVERIVSVFIDAKTNLVWMPIELPHANWFDTNEAKRESDTFGNADEDRDSKFGCKAVLGPEWRVPTLLDVGIAIENGIRRHSSFSAVSRNWDYFWTANSVQKPKNRAVYGVLATFANKEVRHSSRWLEKPIVCVARQDELRNSGELRRNQYNNKETETKE